MIPVIIRQNLVETNWKPGGVFKRIAGSGDGKSVPHFLVVESKCK
jgi:hypothetical protein